MKLSARCTFAVALVLLGGGCVYTAQLRQPVVLAAMLDAQHRQHLTECPLALCPTQTGQPRECELKRVRLSSIRRRLGLQTGGARALGVLGMLSGSGARWACWAWVTAGVHARHAWCAVQRQH